MRARRPRHRILSSTAAALVAGAAVVAAIAACAASRDVTAPKTGAGSPPDVLKLPAREVHGDGTPDSIAAMLPAGDNTTLRTGKVAASVVGRSSLINDVGTVVDASAHPASSVPAPRSTPSMPPKGYDGPYFEFQVERPVVPASGSPGPRYPDSLKVARVEGTVMAQFVVDTTGRAIPESYKVLKADNDLFVQAVKAALPNMRFEPALVGGKKVKQLVQQPFQFSLAK